MPLKYYYGCLTLQYLC